MAVAIAFAVVVLLTRSWSANAFVSWDEPAWVFRSVRFLQALEHARPGDTLVTGHPGVTVMWLGSLSLAFHRHVTGLVSQGALLRVAALPALDVHDPEALRWLTLLLPRAKDGIILAHALMAAALYLVMRRLLTRQASVAALTLMVLNPFFMGLSRLLHMDALTAQFMMLAWLTALVRARGGSRRFLLASAAATAWATLTKTYGAFVAPAIVAILIWPRGQHARQIQDASRANRGPQAGDLALWMIASAAVALLTWPALWATPTSAIAKVVGLAFQYAADAGDATATFFRGQHVEHVGLAFYPYVLAFRSSPLTLLGTLLSLWLLIRTRGARVRRRPSTQAGSDATMAVIGAALAVALLHAGLLSLSSKKFDRYLLPTVLALDIAAGVALSSAISHLAGIVTSKREATRRVLRGAMAPALVVAQGIALLSPLWPKYVISFANPLLGGIGTAVRVLPMGWGEGIDGVAEYLASLPNADETTVATWSVAGLARSFPGHLVKPSPDGLPRAERVVLYVGDVQCGTEVATRFVDRSEAEFTAMVNGIPFAWVYSNDYWSELGARINATADERDAILLSGPAALTRHYEGPLPVVVSEGKDERTVALGLGLTVSHARDVYLVSFDGDETDVSRLRQQLVQVALRMEASQHAYGQMERYRRVPRTVFRPLETEQPLDIVFGDALALRSYGLSSSEIEYRQSLGVACAWAPQREITEDYHLFLHLVDERGRKVGQFDGPIRNAYGKPTSTWDVGSEHVSREALTLQPGVVPGQYRLLVGVYHLGDPNPLLASLGEASVSIADVELGLITVAPASYPPAIEDLPIATRHHKEIIDGIEVLGYSAPESARAGDRVSLGIWWHATKEIGQDYELVLGFSRGQTVHWTDPQPMASPSYPTSRWSPDDVLLQYYDVTVPKADSSASYTLRAQLVGTSTPDTLPQGVLDLSDMRIEAPRHLAAPPTMQHTLRAALGDHIALLGYDMSPQPSGAADTVRLTLYWRADAVVTADYAVFCHIVGDDGAIVAQHDGVPGGGARPTSGWGTGEVIVDTRSIDLSAISTGRYRVLVGMYDPLAGERLAVRLEDGRGPPERSIALDVPLTLGASGTDPR